MFILFITGSGYAETVARQSTANPYSSPSQPAMLGDSCGQPLTPMSAGCVGGLTNAHVESVDPAYANITRMLQGQKQTKKVRDALEQAATCQQDWNSVKQRAARNTPKGMKASMAQLEASANKVGLDRRALYHAVGTYLQNQTKIPNQRYLSIVDYDKNSKVPRWHFFDLETGAVKSIVVSNGRNSDLDHDGMANYFSNDDGSNSSSLGCSVSGGTYDGHHHGSIRLHGLESTNSNNCQRSIVIHQTDGQYVAGSGRSNGCLAVQSTKSSKKEPGIAEMLAQGGMVCNWKAPEKVSKSKYDGAEPKKRSSTSSSPSPSRHRYSSHRHHVRRRRNAQPKYQQYSYSTYGDYVQYN
jgi:hypothetical protein